MSGSWKRRRRKHEGRQWTGISNKQVTDGGICTKAMAARDSWGPQASSMAVDSVWIQSATVASTQSGRGCGFGLGDMPPREINDQCSKNHDEYSPRESKNHRTRTGARSKLLNSHSIENELVRIYHANSGKSTCTSFNTWVSWKDEGYDLLGPNSCPVLRYLQLLEATTSCNSRERLAVHEEFPQGGWYWLDCHDSITKTVVSIVRCTNEVTFRLLYSHLVWRKTEFVPH